MEYLVLMHRFERRSLQDFQVIKKIRPFTSRNATQSEGDGNVPVFESDRSSWSMPPLRFHVQKDLDGQPVLREYLELRFVLVVVCGNSNSS
jgi:hypothetical protein